MIRAIMDFNGILLIDKPQEWTSHDVVAKMRGILHTRRIGHAGTLDPLATGLLVVLVGSACKASQYLMSQEKAYEGTLRLGVVTNSQDADGEIVATNPVPADLTSEKIAAAMKAMEGDQYQIPPMFSAIKVNGVPLYKAARKGQDIPRDKRFIRIAKFEMRGRRDNDVDFFVECSKGTYVRTIAHDLGAKLGVGAHLAALRRTASGKFTIDGAISLEKLQALSPAEISARLLPVAEYVPSVALC
ncbi:MAG: tRNA pseudouridine(55) synthase TruB [Opitutae bacterium]|nr:tRNA pseudouridine(55) synthase TruB [Opitutae bacterium]